MNTLTHIRFDAPLHFTPPPPPCCSLPRHRVRRGRQPRLLHPARRSPGLGGQPAGRRRRRPATQPLQPGPRGGAARRVHGAPSGRGSSGLAAASPPGFLPPLPACQPPRTAPLQPPPPLNFKLVVHASLTPFPPHKPLPCPPPFPPSSPYTHPQPTRSPLSFMPPPLQAGSSVMTELLLQSGAHIDAVDVMRRSPLMYAVLYDQPQLARLLLRCGGPASAAPQRKAGRRGPRSIACWCHARGWPQRHRVGARRLPVALSVLTSLRKAHPISQTCLPCARRRGAACSRDRHGLTPAQLAAGRVCGRDPELLALLSRQV
jgi:hypothetical protein